MLEKLIPVVEAVSKEVGPTIEVEFTDGKELWADVHKAITDLKVALDVVKTAFIKG